VRWIDKVLEIALERMPTALPEDVPAAVAPSNIALAATATTDAVKH
jgi:ATP-dependent Lon protease